MTAEQKRWFSRRGVKRGECLSHVARLLHAPREWGVMACAGLSREVGPHRWLELADSVIDLCRPERFFPRAGYYAKAQIVANTIHRHSVEQCVRVINGEGTITFEALRRQPAELLTLKTQDLRDSHSKAKNHETHQTQPEKKFLPRESFA